MITFLLPTNSGTFVVVGTVGAVAIAGAPETIIQRVAAQVIVEEVAAAQAQPAYSLLTEDLFRITQDDGFVLYA